MNEESLNNFIIEAKKATYATENRPTRPSTRLKSKDLAYENGNFKYWDTYIGNSSFSGTEVVWYEDEPVWSMVYMGKMLEGKFGGDVRKFLMAALSEIDEENPYRGPSIFESGTYSYRNRFSGTMDWFYGTEQIYSKDHLIYELEYRGGRLKQ